MELLSGQLPLFDPYGWDPDQGLDDAIALLGWTCQRQGADDDEPALAMLCEAVKAGPVLAGPARLTDAATALAGIGRDQAAAVATRQARLVGSLQYDIVTGASESAAETLRLLAPTYDELAAALAC
jgi:hypothetical protein